MDPNFIQNPHEFNAERNTRTGFGWIVPLENFVSLTVLIAPLPDPDFDADEAEFKAINDAMPKS